MPTQVKEEKWEINIADGDVTSSDPLGTATTGEVMLPFHEYVVPIGTSLIFTAEDVFELYLYELSAECGDDDPVDVIVMDSSKQNSRALVQQLRYGNCQFMDESTGAIRLAEEDKCHLDIPPGEQIIVREGERILVRAYAGAQTIDGSECYFRLTCKRIRHTLFG